MNAYQTAYLVAMVALTYPAWGRQLYALLALWANLAVTLAICLAMDLGTLDRDGATVSMLLVDLATGVSLSLKPGISRLIAWGYAITVPLYFLSLTSWAEIDTTFALVYIAATAQLGVLAIGSLGNGGGGYRRRAFGRASRGAPTRNAAVYQGAISPLSASDGVER